MVNTEFYIDEEKRTVVCVITTFGDLKEKARKYGFWDIKDDWWEKRVYRGVAKCAPEDEWDEKYGMQLAEYKASRARMVDVNNEIKKFINQTAHKLDNLYDYGLLKEPHKPDVDSMGLDR